MTTSLPAGCRLSRTAEGVRINAKNPTSRVVLTRMLYQTRQVPGVESALLDELGLRVRIPAQGDTRDWVVAAVRGALEAVTTEIELAKGWEDVPLTIAAVDRDDNGWWQITSERALDASLIPQFQVLFDMAPELPLISPSGRIVLVRVPPGSQSWPQILGQVKQLVAMHGESLGFATIEGTVIRVQFTNWPELPQLGELFARVASATGVGSVAGGFDGFTVTVANQQFTLTEVAANVAAALQQVPGRQPTADAAKICVTAFPAHHPWWTLQTNVRCTPAVLAALDAALDAEPGTAQPEANGYSIRVSAALGPRWNRDRVQFEAARAIQGCYAGQ